MSSHHQLGHSDCSSFMAGGARRNVRQAQLMKLQDALKVSLDELRMQMLGVQVLFGFAFQGMFQSAFEDLPGSARVTDAAGLGLMTLALGLLIAVPCQHRLVEAGETTLRIFRLATRYAKLALLPLAGGIACGVFVATRRPYGAALSATVATLVFLLAMAAWYGLGMGLRRAADSRLSEADMKRTETPLHVKIEQMLTEARVILPGAQALLGFQLIVMMTKAFDELPATARMVHLVALVSLALAIILLISPAAIHRIAFEGGDDPRLHQAGSILITVALLPLACGISCDLWVALVRLFGAGGVALGGTLVVSLLLLILWYFLPLVIRRRRDTRGGAPRANPF